jgi:putative ABC transport system substrate-binding protein
MIPLNIVEACTMPRCTPGLILALTCSLFVGQLATAAQQSKKVPMVGMLFSVSPPASPDWKQSSVFLQELRTLGWTEGQNMTVEYRWASGRFDRLATLAAELVRLNVDVIVVSDTLAIGAAQHATTTIPIVMLSAPDPVAWGYVASLAHPGGNITGVGGLVQELSGKLLELLKEAVPQVTQVAVLVYSRQPDTGQLVSETTRAARALGVQPSLLEVQGASELGRAFDTAAKEGDGALLILPGLFFSVRAKQLATLAVKYRLPAIYWHRQFVEQGGLMAYGPNTAAMWRRVAAFVDKILKGAKPADLPVEQPTQFELVINLKTAKELDLTIPPTLLFLADEVIR